MGIIPEEYFDKVIFLFLYNFIFFIERKDYDKQQINEVC